MQHATGTWLPTGALGSTATLLLSDNQVPVAILSLVASFATTGREALACTALDELAEARTHSRRRAMGVRMHPFEQAERAVAVR